MNRLFNLAFGAVIQHVVKQKVREGSIKAVKAYISAVKGARLALMGLTALGVTASILVSGIVLMIIGLVGLFTLNANSFAITMLVIGAVLTLLVAIGFALMFSQKRWLELSKSYELMDAVLAPWPGVLPPNPLNVVKGEYHPDTTERAALRDETAPAYRMKMKEMERESIENEIREREIERAGLEPHFAR